MVRKRGWSDPSKHSESHENGDHNQTLSVLSSVSSSSLPSRKMSSKGNGNAKMSFSPKTATTSFVACLFLITLLLSSASCDPSPQPIMSLSKEAPSSPDGVYSLFPDEDLRTGRKIRFGDEERTLDRGRPFRDLGGSRDRDRDHRADNSNRDNIRERDYYVRERDNYRSYHPIRHGHDDHLHRPVRPPATEDYRYSNRERDPFRTRGSRVYFEEDYYRNRDRDRDRDRPYHHNDDHRFIPPPNRFALGDHHNHNHRPPLLQRPLPPPRPLHPSYYPDVPVPGPSHSKLPVNANTNGGDVRIHVFDPESNSFGNPRNSGRGGSGSSHFVENGGPSPELFLNRDQYLEYHRKIAATRDQEFRRMQALGHSSTPPPFPHPPPTLEPDQQRVLFTAKQPFDVGLSPPAPDATTPSTSLSTRAGVPGNGGNDDGKKTEVVTSNPVQEGNEDVASHKHSIGGNGKGQEIIAVYAGSIGNEGEDDKASQVVTLVTRPENNRDHGHDNDGYRNDPHTHYPHHKGSTKSNGHHHIPPPSSTTPPQSHKEPLISNEGLTRNRDEENKQIQAVPLPLEQPRSRPTFISKSGRRLAYEQVQRQQIRGHNDIQNSLHESVREPLASVSNFQEVTEKESHALKGDHGQSHRHEEKTTTPKTTSTTSRSTTTMKSSTSTTTEAFLQGSASPIIEISVEEDAFTNSVPDFPETKPLHEEQANYFEIVAKNPEKSSLGTAVQKSRTRVKANSSKIAIIRQQELKQMRKQKKSQQAKPRNKVKKYTDDHLQSNSQAEQSGQAPKKWTRSNNSTQNNALNLSNYFESSHNNHDGSSSPTSFQIPLLNMRMRTGTRVKDMNVTTFDLPRNPDGDGDQMRSLLKQRQNSSSSSNPFRIENNDLMDPQAHLFVDDKNANVNRRFFPNEENPPSPGHLFTLINTNNGEEVEVVDEDVGHRQIDINLSLSQNPEIYLGSGTAYEHENSDEANGLFSSGRSSDDLTTSYNTYANSDSNGQEKKRFAELIKVTRIKRPSAFSASFNDLADADLPTAEKTLSNFIVEKTNSSSKPVSVHVHVPATNATKNADADKNNKLAGHRVMLSSSINSTTLALLKAIGKTFAEFAAGQPPRPNVPTEPTTPFPLNMTSPVEEIGLKKKTMVMKTSMTSSASRGVISKVHAHVSHCPKLKAPAEIICDIHIRDGHGHDNPQLTVGWRRKFYNSTQPDILLVSNKTQVYDEDDEESPQSKVTITTKNMMVKKDDGQTAQDFHDRFNVTLAPGISPMLRSVLLIRTVTAPDTGNYECQVTDGIYTLSSETLLFLCH